MSYAVGLKDIGWISFFGYTHCPDVCPLILAKIQQALADLDPADRERVQFIFISTDPERDTPDVLARYLSNFNPEFMGRSHRRFYQDRSRNEVLLGLRRKRTVARTNR